METTPVWGRSPGWLTPGRLSRGLFWCLGLPPGGGVYPHGSAGDGSREEDTPEGRLARAGLRRSCRGGLLERVLHRRGRRLFSRCWETGRPLWRGDDCPLGV